MNKPNSAFILLFLCHRYGQPDDSKWQETFKIWPEKLLTCTQWNYEALTRNSKHPRLELSDNFTMGTLPYLFGKDDRKSERSQCDMMRKRMDEYLKTIVKDQYKANPVKVFYDYQNSSFVNQCENVRNMYRNRAAHIDVVNKQLARECYEKIAGGTGLINTMYNYLR